MVKKKIKILIMKRTKIIDFFKHLDTLEIGGTVSVKGWVRTKRGNNAVAFIALNDGSIVHSLQIVVDPAKFDAELLKKNHDRLMYSCDWKTGRVAGQGADR